MLPEEAVMVTLPLVVAPVARVTTPFETVARLVLLEVQVATSVIGTEPLHVAAVAVKSAVVWFEVMEPLDGDMVIDWMQPTVTVTVCVPVMDGSWFAVAVTVAVPVATDVTSPVVEIVATDVGVILQTTLGLLTGWLSLFLPDTVICTVLPVFPVSIVGDAGPTLIDSSVGFVKNPRQLMAKARVASTARAPARRSLCGFEDMIVKTPWARPLYSKT
jgi:hypothetical protein